MGAKLRAGGMCGGLAVILMAGSLLWAQDATKPDAAPTAPKKVVKRLPANFGKLDLSQEQRAKIHEIQDSYRQRITDLRKQLADLQAKQQSEVDAVLKPEQVTKLETLRAESRRRRNAANPAAAAAAPPAAPAPNATSAEKK